MKPIQIGLLVAAGAIGGALIMKWESPSRPAASPAAATQPAPPAAASTPAVAQPVTPAEPAAEPATPTPPSPFPEKNKVVRKVQRPKQRPAAIAQNRPPAPPAAPPAQPPAAPAPAAQPPATSEPIRSEAPPAAPAAPVIAAPAPIPPPPNQVTLKAGTLIPVRLVEGLSSDRNAPGDTFTATLDAPLIVDGFAIAERGARVEGKVVDAQKAGKVQGLSSLVIELTSLKTSDGQRVRMQTESFTKKGPTSHGEDAAKVGVGAGIGAVIGGIAGGGKGAGIGAVIGGAAGAGDVMLTRGKPAVLSSETRISFRLRDSVTVTERVARR